MAQRSLWTFGVCALAVLVLSFTSLAERVPDISPGFAMPEMEKISSDVYVAQIAPDLWVHTTLGKLADGSPYAANGALVIDGNRSVLIDVGWTPEEAQALLQWAETQLKHPLSKAYVTHFHNDRLGGIPALTSHHIPVYGTAKTLELARKSNQPLPDHPFDEPSTPTLIAEDAVIFFPGAGHTSDNLVAYFPKDRVLFGGCFLKAGNATGIGNAADADLKDWPRSIKKMQAAFPDAATVIPGHGPISNNSTLRTLELLK